MEQELLLSIDWLGLTLRTTSTPLPIAGHQWREYSATNVWAKRRVLWSDEGDRVCTLLSEPRSSTIKSNMALLEIDNEWLYHGTGTEEILSKLATSFFFEVVGISRLDLAVDFCPTEEQAEIMRSLSSGDAYVQGKQNGSTFWSVNTNEKLHPMWLGKPISHQLSWGHKTSSIRWKLYYKTKELLDAGGGQFMDKPYIVDQWRARDMDISNVWRLEVSMHHLNDYNLYGQRIDLDVLKYQRASIFMSLFNSRFKVRKNEKHKDRTNDTLIDFLPIENLKSYFKKAPAKTMREHHGRITLLRHLAASLEDEHVYLDRQSREAVLDHMSKVIQRDHLQNYFYVMVGKWFEEYAADVREYASCTSNEEKTPLRPQGAMKPNLDFDAEWSEEDENQYFAEEIPSIFGSKRTENKPKAIPIQTKMDLLP